MTTPTDVPAELIAGDTWAWTRDLTDYPAGTWTATVYFINRDAAFNVAGSASGTTHSFSIAAATTATYKPGRYVWSLRVTNGSTTTTVDDGAVEVQPNPAGQARDTRSWARRTLEAVECFLAGNATTAQASMTIRDRSISRWSLKELQDWRDKLRGEVRAEEQGESAGLGRDIRVRFRRG